MIILNREFYLQQAIDILSIDIFYSNGVDEFINI